MSDNSNITRNDLVAVGYAIYTALHDTLDKEPLDHAGFEANCIKYFKDFSDMYEE